MQEQYEIGLKKIKQNLRGCRDEKIRRKVYLIIRILESKRGIAASCRQEGVPRQTFYRWLKKLKNADFDLSALKDKSRRPHLSSNQTPSEIEDKLLKLRKEHCNKGGKYIAKVYESETGKHIAGSTVDNIFSRRGVTLQRKPRNPNFHNRRYAMKSPLERVRTGRMGEQWSRMKSCKMASLDSVSLEIEDSNGNKVYAITAIDDCSRFAFIKICHTKGAIEARDALEELLKNVGKPKLVQTDNGVEFTCKFTSLLNPKRQKEAKQAAFEQLLEAEGIEHYLIRPGTPQLNGKIERFHLTLKTELDLKALDGKPFEVIVKAVLDWMNWYNYKRYHSSINYLTPYEKFTSSTKLGAS